MAVGDRLWALAQRGLGMLLLVFLGVASALAEDRPVDEEFLRLAAEADGLREDRRRLQDAWRDEEARLRLVEQALADEAARLDRRLAEQRRQETAVTQDLTALRRQRAERDGLQDGAEELASAIETELTRLRQDSLLAIHQIGDESGAPAATTAERLAAAFDALARAERQSRAIVRRHLSGRSADGRRRAAEVIAIGGAGAWWLGADGAGGPLRVVAGELLFEPAADPATRAAVEQAFAVQAGTEASRPLALPVAASGGGR